MLANLGGLSNCSRVELDSCIVDNARRRYQERATAIEQYCQGRPIDEIEERSREDRRVHYRLIERAVQPHPGGRPWGFRALIPGMHVRAHQRIKPTVGATQGLAGSFRQLLDHYPSLEQVVKQLILDRDVLLIQVGNRRYLKNLASAHRRFTAACRTVGLTANDYPLNQDEQDLRSLAGVLRDRLLGGFADFRCSPRGSRQKPANALAFRPSPAVTESFDSVEFDAHQLDVRLTILDQDPYGDEQTVEMERVWLLALIDIGTRVILGYSLCLRREYGRYDVIRTLEKALSPAQKPQVSIPEIEPIACGGFASVSLPETAHACWRQIRFDNARAHFAEDSLDVV